MTLVAGFDSSTQSCKVLVTDLDSGQILRQGSAPHPPGTAVDPVKWWNALLAAVKDAGGIEDVSAISVGGQQHGMVALDGQGNVVRDALMWNDTSSHPQVDSLTEKLGKDEWIRRTGLALLTSFTITKIRWMAENEPENAQRTEAVVLPHDYLTWRLTGGGPGNFRAEDLSTDRSDASGTAYWSGATEDYCTDLFEMALGHSAQLPRVLGPTDIAGHTAAGLPGIPEGIPIGVGGGDNALAALGLGLEIGDVGLSLGTSGTVFAPAPDPIHDPSGVISGFADATGKHLPLAATLNAARDMDVVASLLGVTHDQLAEMATTVAPGSDGLTLLPYFEGERTPALPQARASLLGMSLSNTSPAHLARATIEGMLCSQVAMLDALIDLDVPVNKVFLIGGAAKSAGVAQILPQIVSLPICLPEAGEYVALGAAKQAVATLTGDFPGWRPESADLPQAEHHPIIMDQHLAGRASIYGV